MSQELQEWEMWNSRVGRVLQLSVWAAAVACGAGDALAPARDVQMADLAGSYAATEFTATTGSQTINQLLNGSTVAVTLAADGTWTSSYRVYPAAPSTMSGTWTLSGTQVRLLDFDTVGLPSNYTVRDNALSGSHGFGVTIVALTLKR